jgi:hypothetical protein
MSASVALASGRTKARTVAEKGPRRRGARSVEHWHGFEQSEAKIRLAGGNDQLENSVKFQDNAGRGKRSGCET